MMFPAKPRVVFDKTTCFLLLSDPEGFKNPRGLIGKTTCGFLWNKIYPSLLNNCW